MNSADFLKRRSLSKKREIQTHLFEIGQAVRLLGGFGKSVSPFDIYHITATLPPQGGSLQYRIRSEKERHERVTTQDRIEAADIEQSDSEAPDNEKSVGHG